MSVTYREYASRAAVGRRLASGPFSPACGRGVCTRRVHACLVLSRHTHARVLKVSARAARALPGAGHRFTELPITSEAVRRALGEGAHP